MQFRNEQGYSATLSDYDNDGVLEFLIDDQMLPEHIPWIYFSDEASSIGLII